MFYAYFIQTKGIVVNVVLNCHHNWIFLS